MWQKLKCRIRKAARCFAPQREALDHKAIYENLNIGIYRSSLDGRQLGANPALVRLNGYESENEMLASVTDIAREWYVEPGRRDEFRRLLAEQGSVENFISEIYRHKTRERIWVVESARLVRDPATDEPQFYEGTVQEITETYRRLEVEERFRKIAAEVPGCLYQYRRRPDGAAYFPYVSAGVFDLFGVPASVIQQNDKSLWERVHPDDLPGFIESGLKCVQDLSNWSHEFRIVCPGGAVKWIHGNSSIELKPDGTMDWYGFMTDITGRKLAEAKIRELAYYDHLTGLPNRRLLLDRLAMSLERSERSGHPGILLFIDLDDFKVINDTLGHEAGDKLLQEVARRLRMLMRNTDSVARLGGDEFVIIADELPQCGEPSETIAARLCNQVRDAIAQPYEMAGHMMSFSASVGASIFCGHQLGAEEILGRADLAMYAAKGGRKNAVARAGSFKSASSRSANGTRHSVLQ